jgi:phosphoribosylformimino-5-aminoimidazole carboxamide ribotide isomerase
MPGEGRQIVRVLPVIDLLRGDVVRGVAGEREKYRPIVSQLATDARPESIGHAIVGRGFRDCYVADLDAIAGAEPDWRTYATLMRAGLKLWIDAGCGTVTRAHTLATFQAEGQMLHRILVGLETLESVEELTEIVAEIGVERLVFGLDLKQGRPLTRIAEWRDAEPLTLLRTMHGIGVRSFVILDLAAVGVNGGPATASLCAAARESYSEIEITSGGGVRGVADLESLATAGCDYALVASALHDGRLSAEALQAFQ